jgi:hypothetical protein
LIVLHAIKADLPPGNKDANYNPNMTGSVSARCSAPADIGSSADIIAQIDECLLGVRRTKPSLALVGVPRLPARSPNQRSIGAITRLRRTSPSPKAGFGHRRWLKSTANGAFEPIRGAAGSAAP